MSSSPKIQAVSNDPKAQPHHEIVSHARLLEKRCYRSINEALEAHGINLAELADELGFHNRKLDLALLVDIALSSGVSICELFRNARCFYGDAEDE
jgi:hypothetical protein